MVGLEEYGGKLRWLSWILRETMSLLHVFMNLLAKGKGNKGMMKSGSKRKVEN